MNLDPASQAVNIGATIANTVAGINDVNKRRKFEESLGLLSNAQMNELNEKLAAATDENDKIAILSQSLTTYLTENAQANSKKEIYLYIAAGGIAVVLLIGIIVYSIKSKG